MEILGLGKISALLSPPALPTLLRQTDLHGQTPLHYAARSGNQELVIHLVDAKADVSLLDANERSAFVVAVLANSAEVVDYFLDFHLDNSLKALDQRLRTPLMLACYHKDGVILQKLISVLGRYGGKLTEEIEAEDWEVRWSFAVLDQFGNDLGPAILGRGGHLCVSEFRALERVGGVAAMYRASRRVNPGRKHVKMAAPGWWWCGSAAPSCGRRTLWICSSFINRTTVTQNAMVSKMVFLPVSSSQKVLRRQPWLRLNFFAHLWDVHLSF